MWASGTSAHRALTLVFYVGGGLMLLFALLTRGAEGRAWSPMGGVPGASGIFRGTHVREQERTLNPTGVLVIAAVALFAIGIAIESSEEGGTVHYAAAFPPA